MPSLVTKRPAKARGWWGDGPSPTVTWPGVTIDLPAAWKPKRHRWESPDGRYWFDKTESDRACAFFSQYLRHHMGEFAGHPFDLLPYQRLLVVVPFCGWKSTVTDLRRFRKVFAFIPKGGGKSPLGAGLGLFFTFCDREPGAEGYAVAADKKQARTVHDNARIMVETMTAVEPEFGDMFTVYRDSIECADTHSTYQVISADASTKHGFRPHVVIFDEFHAQKNRDLYEVLKRSMVKRRQPVMFIITHAGDDDEGICVAPETKVLTADLRWVQAGDVEIGDVLAGFEEHRTGPGHRMWQSTVVTEKTLAELPSYELVLSDGTTVICSEQHMWLVQTAGRRIEWRRTKDLTPTDMFFKVLDPWGRETSWDAGYLAGLLDGEGHLSPTARAHMLCGFTQRANETSALGQTLLTARGMRFGQYETSPGVFQTMVTRKRDVLRLLGSVRPARLLRRFAEIGWEHLRFKAHDHPTLKSHKRVGVRQVVGLKTTTHTFVAEGLASHNCYEEYEYAKGVLEGRIQDDTCLPVIFEAKTSDDWTDPDLWAKVNPGHGITVKHDAIEQECREAQIEPRKLNDFLRFHLNRWTNQATAWIPIEWWDACQGPMTDADLVGLECAGGLDLAQKWDLACFAVVFKKPIAAQTDVEVVSVETTGAVTKKPVSLNYELWVRPYFWIPENTMRQHEKQDGVPYTLWAEQGLVTPTEGDVIDYAKIYQDITTKIVPLYPKLKEGLIGYDPAFATDLATKLRDLSGLKIAEVLQNYTHISEPAQIVEALIKGKRVRQDGHRLMRWNWSNVSIKQDDAGRIRPVKPRNASKRIDGAVAMLIAQAALSLQAPQPSFQMFFFGGKR